ncbi:MAG TPA: NAD-dependent epimerase/dehydratase family protein [Atribacter sp.]|jgi:UDP-glucose 4-epimerase|uniref:UDP-glucose 4-epimerase n=1 Tax=Candidatus Atribacter allofermentans TaxID=1852833 RepID=A0A1V5T2K3_9BACT|nr:NAD-dependent epimerase/dehydratase family protein [Atribacter sp.]MDD3713437.1 NAD-dependent epimerase/dehydratase family protein [Atribacterota bacterium]OQA60997.1 MAG: UDP-glucose 4-epimerase [Candidatus Atribacteria bacterium ADurb.Bin276]HHT10498.1 NAD-dependent epimerase/dehydratase family protein [Candidatus Atribacteria bacterium]MDI9593643.1 NAD-dependent epimerase/dehydratase family protein [Atribacterota bacterium]HQK82734.1 NAD-dependent epimerase/dehydratase family protein [At
MQILVTGGAGFIGSHIVDAYLQEGHQVVVVDNLSTGKKSNLNQAAVFYPIDICSWKELELVFQKHAFEVVNHHAAQINLRRSMDEPVFDAEVNIIGSLNLFELCRKYGVKKFIFASSGGAIYGIPKQIPVDEKAPTKPLSPYGIAKLSVEQYLEYYFQVWDLERIILRYGNVYGPRQDPQGEAGVISIFCNNILKGDPCIVFGDGSKTRDYVSVHDIASANLLALNSSANIYNLGTGLETSVNQLIDLLQKVANQKISIIYDQDRKGEIERIALFSRQARELLGWETTIPLNKGIEEVFRWYQQECCKNNT